MRAEGKRTSQSTPSAVCTRKPCKWGQSKVLKRNCFSSWFQRPGEKCGLRLSSHLQGPVEQRSQLVVKGKLGLSRPPPGRRVDPDPQETAGLTALGVLVDDPAVGIGRPRVARRNGREGVGIAEGPTGELFHAAGMDGVILPVAVTADEIEIPRQQTVPGQPAEELPGFVLKAADVGVAVPLGGAVGTHHGRGGDQGS